MNKILCKLEYQGFPQLHMLIAITYLWPNAPYTYIITFKLFLQDNNVLPYIYFTFSTYLLLHIFTNLFISFK